jgi:hypothetical protein
MIRKHTAMAGISAPIGNHSFRADAGWSTTAASRGVS